MDVERVPALRLVDFLDEDSIMAFSSVGRTTIRIVFPFREAIVARALRSLINLLREHTGGDTTAEWRAEDDAIEAEFFWRSMASDWDWDDD